MPPSTTITNRTTRHPLLQTWTSAPATRPQGGSPTTTRTTRSTWRRSGRGSRTRRPRHRPTRCSSTTTTTRPARQSSARSTIARARRTTSLCGASRCFTCACCTRSASSEDAPQVTTCCEMEDARAGPCAPAQVPAVRPVGQVHLQIRRCGVAARPVRRPGCSTRSVRTSTRTRASTELGIARRMIRQAHVANHVHYQYAKPKRKAESRTMGRRRAVRCGGQAWARSTAPSRTTPTRPWRPSCALHAAAHGEDCHVAAHGVLCGQARWQRAVRGLAAQATVAVAEVQTPTCGASAGLR